MSIGLIERITGRRAQAEAKRLDSYRDLVFAVADDTDVDPARADAILLDAAKTPGALANDVAQLKQRRIDAETAAKLPELRRQREEASNGQRSLREAWHEFEQKHRERNADLARQESALSNQIRECEAAALRLRQGRPDPREADLRAERSNLNGQRDLLLADLGNNAQGMRGRLHNLKLALKHGPQPHAGEFANGLAPSIVPTLAYDEKMLRDGITVSENYVRDAEQKVAKLDARLAELNAALAEIEARQLSAE